MERLAGWNDDPDVSISMILERPLATEQREKLEQVLSAWYLLGEKGGFTDWFHDMTKPWVIEEEGVSTAEWRVDFGSSDAEAAIAVLIRALSGLADDAEIRIAKLVLGRRFLA